MQNAPKTGRVEHHIAATARQCTAPDVVLLWYLQRVIWVTRYKAIPEPLVSRLPQDVAQLAVKVLWADTRRRDQTQQRYAQALD